MAELLLFSAPPATQPALLLFGQDEGELVSAALDAGLPPPTLAAQLSRIVPAWLDARLGSPTLDALAVDAARFVHASAAFELPAPSVGAQLVNAALLVAAQLDFSLPPPMLAATAQRPQPAELNLALGSPSLDASADWHINVERPVVGQTGGTWQRASAVSALTEDCRQAPTRLQPPTAARWAAAAPLRAGVEALKPRTLAPTCVHVDARRSPTFQVLRRIIWADHQDMARLRRALQAQHQTADQRRTDWASGYQDRERLRSTAHASAQASLPLRRGHGHQHAAALPARLGRGARWQEAMVPPPGYGWQPPITPEPEPCYLPDPHLAFTAAAAVSGHLVFICDRHPGPDPQEPIVVPVRRVYMVTNSVSLVRVSDGAPIPPIALRMSLDVDSWAWGFSAEVPATLFGLVEPTDDGPVELLATINGMAFHLLAEQVGRDRAFQSAGVRIQGRGRIAELDAPYAPVLSFGNGAGARTAQQLMGDVLTLNGVPMDWAVDWDLDDWLVPADAWSHQGTYISGLNAIAKAAGGYLLPHASTKSLTVLHRYPAAPWEWDGVTPDLVLPADVVRRESKDWLAKPAYNRIFVQGQGQGLLGQVTREGTAGDLVAPPVVDALITDVAAVRQRGRAELGQGGRQITVGLGLPVLAETGIVLPGTFVEYTDGGDSVRGLVRSVSVEAGFPGVWQTIGVETHV